MEFSCVGQGGAVTDGCGGHEPVTGGLVDARWARLPAIGLVALAVAALAAAAVLVLSPDEHHPAGGQAPATTPAAPGVDIVSARTRAGLRSCPAPVFTRPQSEALRGVGVECLGDGTRVELGAALAGRATVLNLWASWCQVCRKELPVLETYAREPGAAQVLGIEVHDDPVSGLSLLTALGVHFPSVADTDDAVIRALRAPAYLPITYVVTPDGVIRQVLPPTPFTAAGEVDRVVRSMTTLPGGPAARPR